MTFSTNAMSFARENLRLWPPTASRWRTGLSRYDKFVTPTSVWEWMRATDVATAVYRAGSSSSAYASSPLERKERALLTLLIATALAAVLAGRAMADEMVKLLPGTSNEINAYVAGLADAKERVLIVRDWFGLTPSTMAEAVWFGRHGIKAVAIDLYGAQIAETHAEAEKLMNGLDPAAAARTIHNAFEAIGAVERPVVIIGYSMGGKIALERGAGLRLPIETWVTISRSFFFMMPG